MKSKARWRDPRLGDAHELEVAQGRLRYFDSGSGPAIVFVHGLFLNANLWRKVVPTLSKDARCISLDLPFGSHDLPMNPDADLSESSIVAMVTDAMEQLELTDVTLVGMDTGGAVCQFIVTQRPERIGRLVLCSCDYRDNFPPALFSYLKLLPYISPLVPAMFAPFRLSKLRRLPLALGWLSKTRTERVVEDTWSLPALVSADVRRDIAKVVRIFDKRRLNEAADLLRGFDRPALIAWSRDDKVFPRKDAIGLVHDLPDARIAWIDDSRTLSMEDQPERLAELIGGFVREGAADAKRARAQPTR